MSALETITRVTPLGVRFRDTATGALVGDGLEVRYQGPTRRMTARINRTGTYLIAGVPGLQDVEWGDGDDAFWDAPPARETVRLEVRDLLGRYLPYAVELEAPERGVALIPCEQDPPLVTGPALPLFPVPGRALPPGAVAVRTELRGPGGEPAAGAVLVVSVDGVVAARGLADERGAVAAIFPMPALPAAVDPPPVERTEWTVELSARYARDTPRLLCALLGQAPATLRTSPDGAALGPVGVGYGADVFLPPPGPPSEPRVLHLTAP